MPMIYEEEGYAIRGAVIEVAKTLGVGFAEEVYQEALEMELSEGDRSAPRSACELRFVAEGGHPFLRPWNASRSTDMTLRRTRLSA